VDGRGGAGEVVDIIDFDLVGFGDIVSVNLYVWVVYEMADVLAAAGVEVVADDDGVACFEEAFGEMAADKAGAAGD